MGRLYKPWSYVGASITESELSDFISNILPHFMVAYSQSKNTVLRTEKQLRHWFASFQDSKYPILEYVPCAAWFFRAKPDVFATRWSEF
jgi:hypothetical protein